MKEEKEILSFNNYCITNHTMKVKRKMFNLTEEYTAYKNTLLCYEYYIMSKTNNFNYIKWFSKEWNVLIKRGELYYADLSPVVGSEQGGVRPILIVQNDIGNKYSPTVIAAAITSKLNKAKLPTHIELPSKEYGLEKDSVVLLEQIRTIDKSRLKEKIGELNPIMMTQVNKAMLISLGVV